MKTPHLGDHEDWLPANNCQVLRATDTVRAQSWCSSTRYTWVDPTFYLFLSFLFVNFYSPKNCSQAHFPSRFEHTLLPPLPLTRRPLLIRQIPREHENGPLSTRPSHPCFIQVSIICPQPHTYIYICIYICIYSWGILIDHEYENGRGYKFHFKRHGPPRVVSRNALSLTISIRRREIWYRIQLLRQICATRSGRDISMLNLINWVTHDEIRGWLTSCVNWSRNYIFKFKNNVCFLNFLSDINSDECI